MIAEAHRQTLPPPRLREPVAGRPIVAIVGGPDIHHRVSLINDLSAVYEVFAIGSDPALAAAFQRSNVRYYNYRLSRSFNVFVDVLGFATLVRLLHTKRPTIVHAFDTKPCMIGRIAARLAGVPIIIGTLPGLGSLYADRPRRGWRATSIRILYEPLQRLASQLSDVTVVQNDEDAVEVARRRLAPVQKIRLIPGSGVDVHRFRRDSVPTSAISRLKWELGIPPGSVVVLMVSRLIESKGIRVYAEAARLVRQARSETRLLLVGGHSADEFDAIPTRDVQRIGGDVQWLGSRSDIETVYAASDIAVLPSSYREGVPRVLLEAAAMGLPLIATASPGCREVVLDGVNGFLLPQRDAPALAAAIMELVTDPGKRAAFGSASRELVTRRFANTVIASKTMALYAELLTVAARSRCRSKEAG